MWTEKVLHSVIYAAKCGDGTRGIDLSKCRIYVFSKTRNPQIEKMVSGLLWKEDMAAES